MTSGPVWYGQSDGSEPSDIDESAVEIAESREFHWLQIRPGHVAQPMQAGEDILSGFHCSSRSGMRREDERSEWETITRWECYSFSWLGLLQDFPWPRQPRNLVPWLGTDEGRIGEGWDHRRPPPVQVLRSNYCTSQAHATQSPCANPADTPECV